MSATVFPMISYIHKNEPAMIATFKNVSYDRWDDAVACYQKERYLAAVYLAGYCIECLLKYVILEERFSDRSPLILKEYANPPLKPLGTHYISRLIEICNGGKDGLQSFKAPTSSDLAELEQWSEQWRYSCTVLPKDAADLFLHTVRRIVEQIKDNMTNNRIRLRTLKPFC